MKNDDAHQLWTNAIKNILKNGQTYADGSRRCRETRNLSLTLQNPPNATITAPYDAMRTHDEWVYPTKQQLVNVIFDEQRINSLDYTYGSRILNFGDTINQVTDYVIPLIKDNPASRRGIIQIYDPTLDSDPQRSSTPGIIYLHFMLRDDALHCTAMLRSNDVFFGYPANLLQIHYVHRWVADELEAPQGTLTTVSNSAHIFHDAYQDIDDILGVNPATLINEQNV